MVVCRVLRRRAITRGRGRRFGAPSATVGLLASLLVPAAMVVSSGTSASAFVPSSNTRVSVSSSGAQGNDSAGVFTDLSADGRYVAFTSTSTNLVTPATSGRQVFIRDNVSGSTQLASVTPAGVQGNAPATEGVALSNDGRYVVFESTATNLVTGDANATGDVFRRDLVTQQTSLVSVATGGVQANAGSSVSAGGISSDGTYVAFGSYATNLSADPSNQWSQIFLRNMVTGTTTLVSRATPSGRGNGDSVSAVVADDGSVAFTSRARNLHAADSDAHEDVYLAGPTGNVSVLSVDVNGNHGSTLYTSGLPSISGDGRYVSFRSDETNLVANDTNGVQDVFVRDVLAATTARVSLTSTGGQAIDKPEPNTTLGSSTSAISSDGRRVAFRSAMRDLVPSDTNGVDDIFVRDLVDGWTVRLSVSSAGGNANGTSAAPSMDGSGEVVAFSSAASNLVAGDTNSRLDAFILRVSIPRQPPDGGSIDPDETAGSGACLAPPVQRSVTGYPVNTATGNFWHTFNDIAIPGRGAALRLSRTYNAQDAAVTGWFGAGWSSSYETRLLVTGSTGVVTRGNGSTVTFAESGGTWSAPPRSASTLVANGDGTWSFTCRAKDYLTFDATGRLIRSADRLGNGSTISYPSSTQVVVTDDAMRTLTFDFSAGRVTSVSDSGSPARTLSYSYTGAGDLTDVIDVAGGHAQFTYDSSHRMLTMRSPKYFGDITTSPSPVTTNHYDADGRVDWQTDPLGRMTSFDYSTRPGSTIVTDPKGNKVRYGYAFGVLVEEERGYGSGSSSTWLYEFDPVSTATTRTIDPIGQVWKATFDASGNKLSSVDPLSRSSSASYNAFNEPLTITDAKNLTTTLTYNAAGDLLTRSTPWLEGPPGTNQIVTLHYDDPSYPGDVTSMTDPAGKTWAYTYDAAGNRITSTDPMGNTSRWCFDTIGRVASSINPRGVASGVTCASASPAAFTSYFTYNAHGDVLTASDALGHLATTTYDDDRHAVTKVDPTLKTTTYVYDAAGQPTAVHRPDSTVTRTEYWADGSLKSQYDGANQHSDYAYDAQGRLRTVTDPLGRVVTFGYDAAGNLVTKQDPGGNCAGNPRTGCTTSVYDVANQVVGLDYSDAATPDVTNITYDNVGRRTAMTDGTGSTTFTWDSLGRMTSSAAPSGTVGYGYDLRGLLTSLVYPNNIGTVSRVYDDAGRLSTVTDWLSKTTTYGYDADSNLTTQNNPNGTETAVSVDNAGAVSVIAHAPTISPAEPFVSFTYTRDSENKVTEVASTGVPADNHTWGYSDIDQITTDSAKLFPYAYDAADNLRQLADGTRQEFDAANQLTSSTHPIPLVGALHPLAPALSTYTYDAKGNRTGRTRAAGALSYTYDQANRLVSHTTGASSTTYTYNGDGLRVGRAGPSATAFRWAVNGGLPLLLVDGTTAYIYGASSQPIAKLDGTAELTYHHDQLGSTRAITNDAGTVIATYTYDAYGAPAGTTGSIAQPFGYAGEYQDTESGLIYLRARFYDPETGQFLTRDPLEAITRSPYGYVGNNPLNFTDPSGLCWGPTCLVEDAVGGAVDLAQNGGEFVVRNRHTIIDVGTTLGAATLTGACIASVACGVAAGAVAVAAVGVAGAGTHVASDRVFRDDHQISVGESLFRAGISAGSGAACALLLTQGCFGSAAFPAGTGFLGSRIGMLGLSRVYPGLFMADLFVLKQGLLQLFPDC